MKRKQQAMLVAPATSVRHVTARENVAIDSAAVRGRANTSSTKV